MRSALILAVLVLCVAGCRSHSGPAQPAGPVIFFDAAGNRMVVDDRAAAVQKPDAGAQLPVPPDELVADLPATAFKGDNYVDAVDFQRRLDEREGQRFYVIPDGSGRRQTLEAGAIGAGEQRVQLAAEPVAQTVWQVCRVIVPLLALAGSRRYDVSFPATDENDVAYAGFLLPVPAEATQANIRAYTRAGTRAFPVLARVDAQGRVLSIVNNMPTQSIPESTFRYGSVGGMVSLGKAGAGNYALLDGARLREKLPAACGLLAPADDVSAGLVTIQFSGSGEQ